RDIRLAQNLELLTAAAEDERITAFQAHNAAPAARGFDEAVVDLVLADAGLSLALADEHTLGIAARSIEHSLTDQIVIEHHVRALQGLDGTQGQQIGIAGSSADEIDDALVRTLLRHRGFVDGARQRCLGGMRAARQQRLPDRPVHDALPEPPRRYRLVANGGKALAIATHERGKLADPLRQHRLDPLAHAPP